MNDDRAFLTYAVALAAGVTSLLTFILFTQAGSIPEPVYVLEHVALGLSVRAYYKAFDGESGWFAVARGVRNYLGLGETEERMPEGVATSH